MRNLIISLIAVTNLLLPARADLLEGRVQTNELVGQATVIQGATRISRSSLVAQSAQGEEPINEGFQSTRVQLRQKQTGVVGVKINEDGTIALIYHPSDLNRFGIVPGDRILAVDGQRLVFSTFQEDCRGPVGTTKVLTIARNGQIANLKVALIDVNILVQYNHNYW
jgi:predicted metalloprotease with PDZ domain